MKKEIYTLLLISLNLSASNSFIGKSKIDILSKTTFKIRENNSILFLKNKKFIVISPREFKSDGRFYVVEKNGTVSQSKGITSGAKGLRTPSGVFKIIQKKRFYSSKEFPSSRNNMNYMLKFTQKGHAIHQGNTNYMSHGCIHIEKRDISRVFEKFNIGDYIIVSRQSFMPFARKDLLLKIDKKEEKKSNQVNFWKILASFFR